jgi:L-ascorbate metabolism protein UlaG (beta-lactamase superfamily)
MASKFTWLGHAGFEVATPSGSTILIDPWLTGNPKAPFGVEGLSACHLLLLTHAHGDHSGDAPAIARRFSPSIVAMVEHATALGKQGLENLIGVNTGGSVQINGVTVTATHARHSSTYEGADGNLYSAGQAMGFVVRLEDGLTFYHAGDTALFGDMKLIAEMYKPTWAMLPIGDHYTMGPKEAAYAARLLGVEKVIPMHWGTFPLLTGTPEKFRQFLEGSGIECVQLEPGGSVTIS